MTIGSEDAGRGKLVVHRRDALATTLGEVSFTFPETLTPDDYDDVVAWLEIVQRKLKRFVSDPAGRAALSAGEGSDA